MQIKEKDIFQSLLNGKEYIVKKIVNHMAMLESQDGKNQLLTDVDTLKIKSFYEKKEE